MVQIVPRGCPLPSGYIRIACAELIDDNYRPGGRVTLGYWLDECHANALEFVWFSLGDGANSGNYYNQSTGSPILARPFFDVQTGQQNSELVAFPNIVEGGIQVSTSSELHSVAALLRQNLREAVANGSTCWPGTDSCDSEKG